MSVVDFPEKENQTTEVTITWNDGTGYTKIVVTAFGQADESSKLLVFYNDHISDLPVLIANQDSVRKIEFKPIEAKPHSEKAH